MEGWKNVKVPTELWRQIKHLVVDANTTLEKWVAEALAEKIEKEKGGDQ